jgi:hypothetical protein
MSLKWPAKDPDETLDYSIDWSRFLGSDTITSVVWKIEDTDGTYNTVSAPETVNGLTITAVSNTDTVATAQIAAGTVNTVHNVVCQITFGASSLIASRTIQLPIREK